MTFPPTSPVPSPSDAPSDNTSVRVCLRVRPLLPYELTVAAQKILSYPAPHQLCISHHSNPRPFTFDFVFDDFATQQRVYTECVQPLVDSFTSGYNTTILAYGQTGSGKTHTMGTAASDESLPEASVGIIPRVIRQIFSTIREREHTHLFTVKVAFLEIYNEEIKDLLNHTKTTGPAPYIREGPAGSIIVANTVEEEVSSYAEMMTQLVKGSQCRVTGSTQMNATSSRSHAIFSIILSQRKLSEEGGDQDDPLEEVITSKFHFVDLAGSERLKRTGAVGDRMKEGININQGLLALGNCISALGGEKKAAHVPFRDSKITRMLQDSLGGNSKTLMIACVSPADVNGDETLNTLKYANRAKNIQNKPVINRDPNSAKIDAFRQRIAVMEEAIVHWRAGEPDRAEQAMKALDSIGGVPPITTRAPVGSTSSGPGSANHEELALLRDHNLTLEAAMQQLTGRMKGLREEMSGMSDRLIQVETERDVLRLRLEKAKDGELKEEDGVEAAPAEVGVLEENRRTIQRMARKILHQKRELDSAVKLIHSFTSEGGVATNGSPATKKRRRRTRRKTAATNPDGEPSQLHEETKEGPEIEAEEKEREKDDEEGHEEEEEESEGPDSEHSPHEATVDEGSEGEDVPLTDLSLSSDTGDDHGDALSLLAEMKEREHEANLRQWTAEGVRLNEDLTRATKELKAYHTQSANVLHLRVTYERKISEMEREMEAIQAERDRVLRELESTKHSNSTEYEQRYEAAVAKYRTQLTQLSEQLRATREKLKENERMKRQLAMDELRIKKLETEIAAAKKAKVTLAKKMEDSAGKYREWCEMKDAKLARVVKESRKQTLMLKKMEGELAKQNLVLQRRNEEKAALQKQISRQQEKGHGQGQGQQVAGKQQQGSGHSSSSRFGSSQPLAAASTAAHRRSPPSTSSSQRPPRSTPSRRPAVRRHHRESPLARAKAMASNAAALSDSAAPHHPSAVSGASEEQLKSSIEQEIAAAVERASRMREVDEARTKKGLLHTELQRVQERMMNNEMSTAAQQAEYSQLEQECTHIQASLTSLDRAIAAKEAEMARLLPQPSPMKGRRKGEEEVKESSVFLSGSEVDYRLFSRIKVGNLDTGKRALVYLIHQAVELSVERGDLSRDVERLQRELDEERRKSGEQLKLTQLRRRQALAIQRCSLTPLQVHYAVQGEDEDTSPPFRPRSAASPAPISPHSPHSFSYQPPGHSHTPPLTNNFLGDDPTAVDIDHSGAAAGGGRLQGGVGGGGKKGSNVFARLTDTSSFTGMYRSIAEDKKQHSRGPPPGQVKKPISFAQPQSKSGRPAPASTQAGAGGSGSGGSAVRDGPHAKWLSHMDSPLLNWPPAAALSTGAGGAGGSTFAAAPSPTAASQAGEGAGSSGRPTGSVFSRLTNPQLYTGAHRARFGLDVQTKHKPGDDAALAPASGSPSPLLSGGAASLKNLRLVSPPRSHSRQSSNNTDYSHTYDISQSASLPTITDSRSPSSTIDPASLPLQGLQPEHEHGPEPDSESFDHQYVTEIRRQIRLSVERDHRTEEENEAEEGAHPGGDGGRDLGSDLRGEEDPNERAPVFHFGVSPPAMDADEDKENQFIETEDHVGVEESAERRKAEATEDPAYIGGVEEGLHHWEEGEAPIEQLTVE